MDANLEGSLARPTVSVSSLTKPLRIVTAPLTWKGINSSMSPDLSRVTPTEDLVLSGQNTGTTSICHGSEVGIVYQTITAEASQSSFPFQGKCFADAFWRGSATYP
jgi:hypothetical protein